MTEVDSWRVQCKDAGDGSGDAIVELPTELLEKMGWSLGDELAIENTDGKISLRLKQRLTSSIS